ncbi:arginine/serine-rich protein 1 isoform X1 [Sinocyclocheilus grahami]|uniref:Arginine/serine-rich protein 1 n=1 Tax=Sinocyclocheilus grahami TaxID=75366 RepID=A0A672LRM7_SINGR|nr:PREDICTED: arginine/serine-rich protein 1-like isoform X1 [Sinocyclocheilus grahami]XP_016144304.1 PREDICTED: arginine/serine-rich protein 1-like isoform X1 [Sinocyclocheilus grahami]
MKEEASPGRLGEGVKLIFDQKAPHGRRSSRSSSSSDSSFSSSKGGRSSRRSRSSSSESGSSSHSHSRSRSHPRCSGRSRCRHRRHSPPRHYRARSRSYSPSSELSSHRRRYHRRRRSPSLYSYSRRSLSRSRSRSRSPVYWRGSRFVGRYRCRFSRSPRSSRDYRNRSRSHERSAVCLSLEEKKCLLNVAKANAARILGVQNLELPASLKELEEEEEEEEEKKKKRRRRRSSSDNEERVSADRAPQKTPAQVNFVANDDGEAEASPTSPKRKPINFSINNTIARPSNSPTVHDSKVTSRADSVADRKPYGQWVPISRSSSKK